MRCIIRTQEGDKFPLNLDRQDKISSIRKTIAEKLELVTAQVRLIYLGKQLEDSHTLYDYSVKDNDTIQVYKKVVLADLPPLEPSTEDETKALPTPTSEPQELQEPQATEEKKIVIAITEEDRAAIMTAQEEVEQCKKCDNSLEAECKECGCNVCGKKNDEPMILICDECQYYFHMYCLPTPLTEIPEGDWYCHECFNDPTKIIGAGDSGKIKAKKTCNRKWDNGMACAGVLKKCTIVKPDHVGAIPGVPVGSSFRYRVHLSESGIHRPPVSGIHGSSKTRAVSIVLAGGYVDDKDFGDHFLYTGSGGRDLSGNKRTAEQSMNQELTRSNLALALTMNSKVNTEEGAVSKDWKKSSPVRVTRSYKLAKESKYAPAEGIRYDGLYKLVRYWPEPGQNGYLVWRYEFRRDDPEPAPWTEEGKARIEELGLTMYCPEGYVVPNTKSEKEKVKPKAKAKPAAKAKKGRGRPRKGAKEEESEPEVSEEEEEIKAPAPKKAKVVTTSFKPRAETLELISHDLLNARTWQLILEHDYPTETSFLEAIMSKEFMCPICHDQVTEPVSTRCGHNACRPCLKQSLLAYGNLCPLCRGDLYPELKELGKKEVEKELKSIANELSINHELVAVLKHLVPSYGS